MRSDLFEPARKLQSTRARIERRDADAKADQLEPNAVDAALADETMPIVAMRGSRRDPAAARGRNPGRNESPNAALLESLAEKLEVLEEQHTQMRRLLDQAGRLRLDQAAL